MINTWLIPALDKSAQNTITHNINQKTKPPGSLGQLEDLALQIALVQKTEKLAINKPLMLVFAGDHGIAEENISIANSAVTRQMVNNFLADGAAINCFCRSSDLPLKVIDAGIKFALAPEPKGLINQRVAAGTHNFAWRPAMSHAQAEQAISLGAQLALREIGNGSNLLAFGEMGIANSSSAAAILAALSNQPANRCVGLGTGINPEQLAKKVALVSQAVARIQDKSPLNIIAEVGGFEIAQICGAMLATAEAGKLIVVDGFIVTAAALLAQAFSPHVRDYMIFAHHSEEGGHQLMLQMLNAKPLLNLGLRLGEGTGAALALPLIKAAVSFYNDMATFSNAQVTDVTVSP